MTGDRVRGYCEPGGGERALGQGATGRKDHHRPGAMVVTPRRGALARRPVRLWNHQRCRQHHRAGPCHRRRGRRRGRHRLPHQRTGLLLPGPAAPVPRAAGGPHPVHGHPVRPSAAPGSGGLPRPLPLPVGRRSGRRRVGSGRRPGGCPPEGWVPHRVVGPRHHRPVRPVRAVPRRLQLPPPPRHTARTQGHRGRHRLRGPRRTGEPSLPGGTERGPERPGCGQGGAPAGGPGRLR